MNVREWALPVYTILMQLATGSMLILWILRWRASSRFNPAEMDRIIRNPLLVIVITAIVAMGSAHFHLSRPLYSFYAVRNFQHSWLSREIISTIFFFLTLLALWLISLFKQEYRKLITVLGWVDITIGFSMVYCMARIYMIPTQVAWNSPTVIPSFYATTLLLGTMAIACLLILDLKFAEIQKADDVEVRMQVFKYSLIWLVSVAFVAVVIDMGLSFYQIYYLSLGDQIAHLSLQLLFQLYTPLLILRFICILVAPLWMGYAVYKMYKSGIAPQGLIVPVYMSCLLILIGEIIGRFLFYATHIRIGL